MTHKLAEGLPKVLWNGNGNVNGIGVGKFEFAKLPKRGMQIAEDPTKRQGAKDSWGKVAENGGNTKDSATNPYHPFSGHFFSILAL